MKKVLSLVLSLCLFVSLGAGISFDVAEAAATDLEYWFDVAGKYEGKIDYTYIGTLTYDAVNALDTNNKSDDWAFLSTSVPSGDNVCGAGNDYIAYLGNGSAITINSYSRAENYLLRLQFKVPTAGKYVPFVNFDGYNAANGHNIPFAIYEVNSDGSLGTQVFDTKWIHSNSQHTVHHYVALSDTAIDFAAGTYAIEFGTVQTKAQVRVRGLKLAAADNAIPTVLNLDKGQNYFEVNAGAKIQIPLSGKLSTGADIAMATSAGWNITADTENVHMYLNKANGTLDITGLAETSANEEKEIKLGNAMVRFNVKVNAADYLAPDKNLVYDFSAAMARDAQCNGGNTLLYGSYGTTYALPMYGKAYGAAYSQKTTSEPWKIITKYDKNGVEKPNLYFNALMNTSNYGIYFYDAGSADVGILVANDGNYIPSVTLGAGAPAADITYTLKKLDGTVLASTTVAKNTAASSTINLSDTPVALEAGEYIVTFSKPTASAQTYTYTFNLTYKSGFTYDVTLNAGEGTVASDVTSYTHGTAVTLPAATLEGYTFDGWFDANDNKVTEIKALDRGDKVYTAKYTYIPKEYTVTLNANGGTLASELTSYTEGVGATLPTATKGIATFGGWYDNADFIGDAVTAIGTDATGNKEFWAKWTVEIPETAEITVTSDSGYYSEKIDSADKEGVIAVSTYFSMFADIKAEISKVGVMIYVEGNEANEAKIARVETTDAAKIAEITDTFSALFTAIAEANFGKAVIAKPYLVVSGEYVYGDAVELEGVNAAKWLGPKA